MIKAAIDKLNGARTLDDILAPIEHKVQELVHFAATARGKAIDLRQKAEDMQREAAVLEHFADAARGKAIDLRQKAEDMQREAAVLEADASAALSIAARMEELTNA